MKKLISPYSYQLLKERLRQIKENPKTILYYLQGNINWFLHGRAIIKFLEKSRECPDCASNGSCLECGCDFATLALSSKTCKKIKE